MWPSLIGLVPMPEHRDYCLNGVWIRVQPLVDNTVNIQHTHDHDHHSVVIGEAELHKDGQYSGTFRDGDVAFVEKGVAHCFVSKKPGTCVLCVKRVEDAESEGVELLGQPGRGG